MYNELPAILDLVPPLQSTFRPGHSTESAQNLSPSTYRSIYGTSPPCLYSRVHPCFRHDIQTTDAVFYLTSSGRFARSSLYSRQAGVSGFWCHRLERPASPRRICAVTRGFQTTTFLFSRVTKILSYDSYVTITIHYYCLETCGPCNIIWASLKCL